MINCFRYYKLLRDLGFGFFTGVPDSTLKDICFCLADYTDPPNHIVAANEGAAIALAAGHYLATRQYGLVYMQNSGLTNAINPLTSLANRDVYGLPMLLLIGCRGGPGQKDAPQHILLGKATQSLLQDVNIPYEVHPHTTKESGAALARAVEHMKHHSSPYALLVRPNTFHATTERAISGVGFPLAREEALKEILSHLNNDAVIVSSTGGLCRELFEYRERMGEQHDQDFLNVGAMGHASQIALGIALAQPDRQVFCLDGDGSLIMHMGALATIGAKRPSNFIHIVFNNGAHDSVGGHPTVGFEIDFGAIAWACGYQRCLQTNTAEDISNAIMSIDLENGPILMEVFVHRGARSDLSRPHLSFTELKEHFMRNLEKCPAKKSLKAAASTFYEI